jgi:hypothetical protein
VETPYRCEHVQQTCEHAEAQAQKKSTNDNDPAASIPEITFAESRGRQCQESRGKKVEAQRRRRLEGASGAVLSMPVSVCTKIKMKTREDIGTACGTARGDCYHHAGEISHSLFSP